MIHDIPELDRKGLREFGLITGSIIAALFGLVFPWLLGNDIHVWPWAVGGGLVFWALAVPDSLRVVYRQWMRFGLLVSKITTPVILGIVFFVVIFPAALVMKIAGRDPMARTLDKHAKSYRIVSRKAPNKNLEKPF